VKNVGSQRMINNHTTWIVGSGGLIGSSMSRIFDTPFISPGIPWNDKDRAVTHLLKSFNSFLKYSDGRPWSIIWSAGNTTMLSDQNKVDDETWIFEQFLNIIKKNILDDKGSFAFISSAGGLYMGSQNPPFGIDSPVSPINPYGYGKLNQEFLIHEVLSDIMPSIIFRVSNAYGIGQNVNKNQGIISKLIFSAYNKTPVNIFAPLETVRDYIFTDDIAKIISWWIDDININRLCFPKKVLIASGQSASITDLINIVSEISGKTIYLNDNVFSLLRDQATNLIFEPVTIPQDISITNLYDGIQYILNDTMTSQNFERITC
jgi:UDP-glucose 4-epimerase